MYLRENSDEKKTELPTCSKDLNNPTYGLFKKLGCYSFDKIGCNLDLDKFLKQAVMFRKPSLEDPMEESFAQFEFDLDLDMIHEQAKALLDPALEIRTEN